jgi:lipoprotein LpqH
MQQRLVASAAAMVIVACVAGCAERAQTPPRNTAQVTVDGTTRTMDTVSCTQVDWLLTVETGADPTHIRALLRLESDGPSPETVNIENFDGFYGVSGKGVGDVDAAFVNDTYTITGTAEGSNPNDSTTPRTAPFKIEARC